MNTIKSNLSNRQVYVYKKLAEYQKARGYAPSFRELAAICGIALSSIVAHLRLLREKGFVLWEANIPRSLHIVK